jgi:hypothetical protein
VQKITGAIIIVIRATNPSPSGFSAGGVLAEHEPDDDAEDDGG